MFAELLPVGSVVLLKRGVRKLMIIGIKPIRPEEPEKVYDYIGVLYPEGYYGGKSCFLFNQEDVNDIIFRGYENPERQAFLEYVEKSVQEKEVSKLASED